MVILRFFLSPRNICAYFAIVLKVVSSVDAYWLASPVFRLLGEGILSTFLFVTRATGGNGNYEGSKIRIVRAV